MPRVARGCQGLQPRLEQGRIAAVDLMLRPQQAGEIAQQRIDRRVRRQLVPQRRGTRAGRPHPPSVPPRAAGKGSHSPRGPSRPIGRTWRCRRCGSPRCCRRRSHRQGSWRRCTPPPLPGPAAPRTSASPASRPRRPRSPRRRPRSARHTASAVAVRVRRVVPHRPRRKCRPRGLPRIRCLMAGPAARRTIAARSASRQTRCKRIGLPASRILSECDTC